MKRGDRLRYLKMEGAGRRSTGEIEGRREITANRTAPRADIRLGNLKPGLQKLQYRSVVEDLRTHPSTGGPGRDDQHGHAWSQANRLLSSWIGAWNEWVHLAAVLIQIENFIAEAFH